MYCVQYHVIVYRDILRVYSIIAFHLAKRRTGEKPLPDPLSAPIRDTIGRHNEFRNTAAAHILTNCFRSSVLEMLMCLDVDMAESVMLLMSVYEISIGEI